MHVLSSHLHLPCVTLVLRNENGNYLQNWSGLEVGKEIGEQCCAWGSLTAAPWGHCLAQCHAGKGCSMEHPAQVPCSQDGKVSPSLDSSSCSCCPVSVLHWRHLQMHGVAMGASCRSYMLCCSSSQRLPGELETSASFP